MTERLETVIAKIDRLPNSTNIDLLKAFHAFLKANGTSERHQMNSIKAVTAFGHYLGPRRTFLMIRKKEQILTFLTTKEKPLAEDPDRKWITLGTRILIGSRASCGFSITSMVRRKKFRCPNGRLLNGFG